MLVIAANHPTHSILGPTTSSHRSRFTAWTADIADAGKDPWRSTSPERSRAFENTDELLSTMP